MEKTQTNSNEKLVYLLEELGERNRNNRQGEIGLEEERVGQMPLLSPYVRDANLLVPASLCQFRLYNSQ